MKRKCLAVGIILLFIGTAVIPSSGQKIEKTSPMASRGHWLYVGGNGPGNYTKIQDAINASSDGDTVLVFDDSSPYNENIIVSKQISLIGENKETTTIIGQGKNDDILVEADNVLITGFNLSKDAWRDNANVNIISVGCTVENNLIHGCHIGVELAPGDSAEINENIITSVDTGIAMYGTKLSMISHNIISTILHTNNEYCIEMDGTGAGNTIMRNNLTHSYFGLSIYGAGRTIIKENNIANNKYGDFAYNRCSFFVKYKNNYWGGKTGPIVIQGIIPIFYPKPFGHIGEFDIPYYRVDWHPAQEPYNIPGMR